MPSIACCGFPGPSRNWHMSAYRSPECKSTYSASRVVPPGAAIKTPP